METKTLQMKIGSNLGIVLTSIAREKLLYDFDFTAAKNVLIKSLLGFSERNAIDVILGKKHLIVEGQQMTLIKPENNPDREAYPDELDLEKWIYRLKDDVISFSQRFDKILRGNSLRSKIDFPNLKSITVSIGKKALIDFSLNENIEMLLDDIRAENEIDAFVSTLRVMDKFFKQNIKFQKLLVELKNNRLIKRENLPYNFFFFAARYKNFLEQDSPSAFIIDENYQSVKKYFENETRLLNESNYEIRPVKITDLWDAGWLAPNGDFYGINGEIENMLHDKLAERLLKNKIIDKKKVESYYSGNANGWLRANGWIAVHHQTVHSDIPSLRRAGLLKENLHLTKEQQKALSEYAKELRQPLKFCGMKEVRPEKFGKMDLIMFEKLFDFI